jgi:hypothetical protein
MTRPRTARMFACVAACLLVVAVAAQATAFKESGTPAKGFGFAYDPAKEITVVGTLTEIVTHPKPGSPMGMHLLISSSGKTVGPFLSKENREALKAGQLVQITGVNETVHGKNILLARQLTFNGRQVNIRNERGFLRFDRTGMGPRKVYRNGKLVATGGNQ